MGDYNHPSISCTWRNVHSCVHYSSADSYFQDASHMKKTRHSSKECGEYRRYSRSPMRPSILTRSPLGAFAFHSFICKYGKILRITVRSSNLSITARFSIRHPTWKEVAEVAKPS